MRRYLFVFTVICLFLLTGCSNSGFDSTYYDQGLSAVQEFRYSDALQAFKKSINTYPNHTDSYLKAADILIDKGHFIDALEILQNGIGFADSEDELYEKIGEVYFRLRDYDNAELSYSDALNINSDNQLAILGRVEIMARKENFAGLKSYLESRAGILDSYEVEIAKAFVFADDLQKSLEFLDKAENLVSEDEEENFNNIKGIFEEMKNSDKKETDKFMKLSQIIINEGKPALALHLLNEILDKNQTYEGGYLYKGIVYILLQKYQEAEELLKFAVAYNSKLSDSYKYLAIATYKQDKIDDAKLYFSLAKQYSSSIDEDLLYDYYIFVNDINDEQETINTLNNLIALNSKKKIDYQLTLAEHYCLSKNLNEQFEQFLNTMKVTEIQSKENLSRYYTNRGCLAYKKGDLESAKSLIEEAQNLYHGLPQIYYIRALISKSENDEDKKQEYINKVLDVDLDGEYVKLVNDLI